MHPTEAINVVEQVLRDLVREVLGDEWRKHPTLDVAELESKREEDRKKRRGVIGTDDLIAFLEFYHLKEIVEKNWELFAPALGKKKYFSVYMDRLEGFRNPAMHSRELLPFEVSLVNGIAGEIRNQVTIFRSAKGPDMQYYPEILQVSDVTHGINVTQSMMTGITLRPGDTVQFRCIATDPQGRDLRWIMYLMTRGGSYVMRDQSVGDEVTLTWNVEPIDVREYAPVSIRVTSEPGEYHRHGDWDQEWLFHYRVDPELDAPRGKQANE